MPGAKRTQKSSRARKYFIKRARVALNFFWQLTIILFHRCLLRYQIRRLLSFHPPILEGRASEPSAFVFSRMRKRSFPHVSSL